MNLKLTRSAKTLLFFIIIAFTGCEKENVAEDQTISQEKTVFEAKKWLENTETQSSILEHSKQIDWNNAIVTDGAKGKVVEVPLILEDNLTLKMNDDLEAKSFHRLVFRPEANGSFKVSDVIFFTKDQNFDNTNKEINFYTVDKKFNGTIMVVNSKNEVALPREYEKGKELLKPTKNNVTAKAPYSTCLFLGWYTGSEGNKRFTPITMIGCYGSGDSDDYGGPHGGSGGDGSTRTPNTVENNIEKKIDDSKLDPCPKAVMEQLKSGTNYDIAEILRILGASSIYNVNMVMKSTVGKGYAETQKLSTYNYEIRIDRDKSTDGTKLYKATVLIHEVIHAFFLSIVDDYNSTQSTTLASFPELFEVYVKKEHSASKDKQDAQHKEMADKYVNAMAGALQEYDDNSTVPYQVYKDLAWGTLKDAPIFDATFPSGSADNIRIINRTNAEATGHAIAQGTPYEQKPVGKSCN
ncbi:hypothetical protein N4T20_02910 [Flavobacterium sp. TR2]|uniref:hypothetical protein n=1 Tax=Flavobacterium sp. TR2 TaxID=2977321 RepID=UPI0021B117B6|nr:hypothetical protein [Flavobacterium sp. TR2]UWY28882.1 hypothetical protein N4T20_02910 [Flavobacterium sp. TR2]